MGIVSIILGILIAVAGFLCLFTPLLTFMSLGYFIIILFFVYGVWAIINSIVTKRYGVSLVFGILSLIVGIVGLVYPADVTLSTDMFLLFLAGGWFIAQGIFQIIVAFEQKKITGSFGWLFLIVGILSILVGGYSFFHPQVMAFTMGILMSFYFIETGFSLVSFGTMYNSLRKK